MLQYFQIKTIYVFKNRLRSTVHYFHTSLTVNPDNSILIQSTGECHSNSPLRISSPTNPTPTALTTLTTPLTIN